MKAWLNHCALNLGVACEALYYAIVPPHGHHTPEQLADLGRGSLLAWFRHGCGVGRMPGRDGERAMFEGRG